MRENFKFYVPAEIDLVKSEDKNKKEVRLIKGYASTPSKDRDNEEIVQKGLDISDFLDFGWFNFDHDNTKILGYPHKENTRINSEGFYVEGELLKGVPLADHIWEVAVALQKSNAPRKLGFSVEGKVLEKSASGKVLKAKVYNVAITPNPVNPTATWDALVKSFNVNTDAGMTAGHETPLDVENSGSSLKLESLESSLKILARALDNCESAKTMLRELRELLMKRKNLEKSETILYLQLSKGLSRAEAEAVYEKIIQD